MALDDLLDSIEGVAEVFDRIDPGYSIRFRELKKKIVDARSAGRQDIVKYTLITDVADCFYGGMGHWLWDTPIEPPPGMSEKEARNAIDKAMDDMFFNFLFWDTEIKAARRMYKRATKRLGYGKPPREVFSLVSSAFEDWTDWGKLLTDPEIAGAFRTKNYLRPR